MGRVPQVPGNQSLAEKKEDARDDEERRKKKEDRIKKKNKTKPHIIKNN